MPKIVIKEIDKTGESSPEYLDNTVLVPGEAAFEDDYKLYETLAQFEVDFTGELTGNALYAKQCLEFGLPVLYYKVEHEDYSSVIGILKKFEDRSLFDIRFITIGFMLRDAEDGEKAKAFIEEMTRVAAVRGDAIAVCDVYDDIEKDSAQIETFMSALAPVEVEKQEITEDGYKYSMLIAPGFICKEFGDKELPASLGYLGAYAKAIKKFPEWYAVAGSQRGIIPLSDIKPTVEFGEADIDKLQTRGLETENKSCNVICNIRPFGHIVWGNRTLFPLDKDNIAEDTRGELKASNFLNIRQLCCILKKQLFRICRKYTFEPNSDVLWANFKNDISNVLDEMQSGNGIRGYKIEKEAVAKKALLRAKIRIIPIEAVEDFELTVELADSVEVVE